MLLLMCRHSFSPTCLSTPANLWIYSRICSVEKPRISKVLSNLRCAMPDKAVGLVVVTIEASSRIFPVTSHWYKIWSGISSSMLVGQGGATAMFALSLNSSNPSKSMRTPSGCCWMYFQTSSSRWSERECSDQVSNSLRLRSFAELNLLNLTKKAASNWIWELDVALKFSHAQSLRSLMQHNVLPIPGRPTIKTFLFSLFRRSSRLFGCDSSSCDLG